MSELTIDKCVLVHCDSKAADAAQYRSSSLAFLGRWSADASLVACVNAGIRKEYVALSPAGIQWWRAVVTQSRYCEKRRQIQNAQRVSFRQRDNVPLHGEDFDYVDAASQSNTRRWLSNETNWQNTQYRRRIQAAFQVEIQNVNEYMNGVGTQGTAEAL